MLHRTRKGLAFSSEKRPACISWSRLRTTGRLPDGGVAGTGGTVADDERRWGLTDHDLSPSAAPRIGCTPTAGFWAAATDTFSVASLAVLFVCCRDADRLELGCAFA